MTKTVYNKTIRLTKSGQVNKQDQTKMLMAIQSQIESEVRGWEFLAGMDGQDSKLAQDALTRIEALKIELSWYAQKFGKVS